jgi:putative heme iron utilization protein
MKDEPKPAKERSAIRAAELVRRCQVAALGTVRGGAPAVSMVPYALVAEPFAFVVLVSSLSAHTREMLADANVGLMVMEPESGAQAPHALARVSMRGRAEPVALNGPRHDAARAAYSARFPDMVGLFELGDFALFAIVPAEVRVITGFAQAATISAESLAEILSDE